MIDWHALVERQASATNDENAVRLRRVLDHHPAYFDVAVTIRYDDGYMPPDWDGEGERQLEPTVIIRVAAVSSMYGGGPIEEFSPAQVPILAEALEAANEFKIAHAAYSDSVAWEIVKLAEKTAAVVDRAKKMMPLFDRLYCVVQGRVTGNVECIGRAWNLNLFAERAIAAGFPMDVYNVRDVTSENYTALERRGSVKVI